MSTVVFEIYVNKEKIAEVMKGTADPFQVARDWINENDPNKSDTTSFEVKKVIRE
jgi:hypothetical protein